MSNRIFRPGLHILAGDHGVGNTITALNIANAIATAGPIFGMPNPDSPRPVAYCALRASTPRHFLPSTCKVISVGARETAGIAGSFISDTAASLNPDDSDDNRPDSSRPGLIVLDPAPQALPSGAINNSAEVISTFDEIRRAAIAADVPVLLVHFLTKFTRGIARERIAGCNYFSSNMITRTTVERAISDPSDPRRVIYHYPDVRPPTKFEYEISSTGEWIGVGEQVNPVLDEAMAAIDPGVVLSSAELEDVYNDCLSGEKGSSKSSFKRWLKAAQESGEFRYVSKGKYRRRDLQ